MQYLFMALAAVVAVALDQYTKYLTVENIPLHGFSPALGGMIWLFVLVFAVLTVAVIWEFSKKRMPFSTFERWCIAAIWAGGLGNIIDRVRLGYVVDMICLEFMEFPVFNVADCFITCGTIALVVSLIFFNKEFWKDEKKK